MTLRSHLDLAWIHFDFGPRSLRLGHTAYLLAQVKNFICTSLFPTGLSFSGGVDVKCYDGRVQSLVYSGLLMSILRLGVWTKIQRSHGP